MQAVGVGVAFVTVFALSFGTFWIIKRTTGLRVAEDAEEAGLDISEHGMYGYPEQFIPQPEYSIGLYEPTVAGTPLPSSPASVSRAAMGEPAAQT